MNDKDNDISLMRSKKMKANSKTIRRMKVNVRSEESKSKHSY
ncbi:YscQ/HrcQ family type III secretion apparatus protein, partial [Escherichia coli]|nr:YscQ/HrcQ family type III secretion apparatus protein [Escherichia coli]MBE9707202.1 YscQ/HrcQ family type III secretion apparatus protein [Escherichia coli]MBE9825789.1 YscQ/HrcQ family type III secretion apparatus protein [Escherichia coli]MBE9847528.1 YscQ/HrcQ family type III secretion apparatus protein [Escherichia coli]MBW9800227.1 YscQ/HrcQ family type III secretion apparatus protein [Escherichia coli]